MLVRGGGVASILLPSTIMSYIRAIRALSSSTARLRRLSTAAVADATGDLFLISFKVMAYDGDILAGGDEGDGYCRDAPASYIIVVGSFSNDFGDINEVSIFGSIFWGENSVILCSLTTIDDF